MAHQKKSSGRRAFEPTPELRRQVETLAAFGAPHDDIRRMAINPATKRPIGLKTLRKHFRQELEIGASQANAKVVESLFRQAIGAPAQYDARGRIIRAERAPVLAAAVFWMKTRAKLLEAANSNQGEDAGDSGAPVIEADKLDRDV